MPEVGHGQGKGMWSEVQQRQVQVSTEPDFLCRTCIVWGRYESRCREDLKRPQSQRELMTFLGFIQYLKKFMPNMADVSALLRKLTEKDVEWKWTETEENSFNKLKKLATEAPVLRFYDPTLPPHSQ